MRLVGWIREDSAETDPMAASPNADFLTAELEAMTEGGSVEWEADKSDPV